MGAFLLFVLVFGQSPAMAWTTLNHQMLLEASVELCSNELGSSFNDSGLLLNKHWSLMQQAVIAPDVNKTLLPPISLHGHEAVYHFNFLGLPSPGSGVVAAKYYQRAIDKWRRGDERGALFDFGCVLHLVQDTAFCGHSNCKFFGLVAKHSAFENWVFGQTTANKKPLTFNQLWQDGWVVKSGGAYLKEPWSSGGKIHWQGGPAAWVDVSAHHSYDLVKYSMGLDYQECQFKGQARMQFVFAQRCGAGLLVDFLREIGLISGPTVYYFRQGELWSVKLGGNNPKRVVGNGPKDPWPRVSPNGRSRLYHHADGSWEIQSNKCSLDRDLPNDWPTLPRKAGKVFYLNNLYIGLVAESEGSDWKNLYLVPAIPSPDNEYMVYCKNCRQTTIFSYESPDGIWQHQVQKVSLP